MLMATTRISLPTPQAASVAGELDIEVPRRPGRPARRAVLGARYRRGSLQPPRGRYREKDLEPVTVWAVYAHEDHPPPGQEAVSWMLLTTVPVAAFDEATEKNSLVYLSLAN